MLKLSSMLLNAKKAERHPVEMMIVGFFYVSISVFLGLWIFPGNASLVIVFLTLTSCLYVVQGALIIEEKKEKNLVEEKKLIHLHIRTLKFLMFLFIGFLIAFTFWTIALPPEISSEVFGLQGETVREIRSITGKSISPSDSLNIVITNNLRVLFFSLILSIFYGAGAVFILIWNASVLGFVIGTIARYGLGLVYLPEIFFRYLLHGIPEMLAYFIAALAGGIFFIALIKGDLKKDRFKRLSIDVSLLILTSIALVIISALIEVFISARI